MRCQVCTENCIEFVFVVFERSPLQHFKRVLKKGLQCRVDLQRGLSARQVYEQALPELRETSFTESNWPLLVLDNPRASEQDDMSWMRIDLEEPLPAQGRGVRPWAVYESSTL